MEHDAIMDLIYFSQVLFTGKEIESSKAPLDVKTWVLYGAYIITLQVRLANLALRATRYPVTKHATKITILSRPIVVLSSKPVKKSKISMQQTLRKKTQLYRIQLQVE